MSLYYDEIIAGNCLDQINAIEPVSNSTMPSSTATTNSTDSMTTEKDSSPPSLDEQLGFPLDQLFQMARHFLKEKQGSRAVQLKYSDNTRFAALAKQAMIGPWDPSHTPNVGLLDVVGNDRKQAWMGLGNMSKEEAMESYVKLLLERCPMFQHYVEAHHVENEEKDRLRKEDETRRTLEHEQQRIRQQEIEQVSRLEEHRRKREEFQRKQIQEALNQQTYPQFKAYAEQQHKDNRQAQDELIRQLQEQHFQQYMQQVYQQQLQRTKPNMDPYEQMVQPSNTNSSPSINPSSSSVGHSAASQASSAAHPPSALSNGNSSINDNKSHSMNIVQNQFDSLSLQTPLQPPVATATGNSPTQPSFPSVQYNNDYVGQEESAYIHSSALEANDGDQNDDLSDGARDYPPIAVANMWTRKDIKEFKDTVRREKDAVIKIGSGETVTIRVPTHEEGRCIFWEFATDYYDIGFGLYFEWTKAQSNTVTVHISDSSEDDEDGEDSINPERKDVEKGARHSTKPAKPYQDELIPIFRRDSHEEIYAGSHPYPGHGVYLLKFDNSYSLWRSKTLYYRVYYSR